jgi:hypothetical protein
MYNQLAAFCITAKQCAFGQPAYVSHMQADIRAGQWAPRSQTERLVRQITPNHQKWLLAHVRNTTPVILMASVQPIQLKQQEGTTNQANVDVSLLPDQVQAP